MKAGLSFQVLKLCVLLSWFQVHGSSAPIYGSRRPTLASIGPSESPHAAKSRINPESVLPDSVLPKLPFHHHHHHHRNHHHNDHPQDAKLPYEKPAAGPSNPLTPLSYAHHAPSHQPSISPSSYTVNLTPPPSASALTHALLPPPPNQDCTTVTCPEQWTSTLSGSPCGCVLPIQVTLQLSVSLYTFLPSVSELASEIASSLLLNQSQVRIMGANAASQQSEKTIALIYLIPLSEKFQYATPFSVYQKFWQKKVQVNYSLFGAYDVLGVHYPGLPPSPPSLSSNLAAIDNHPLPANHKGNDGSSLKPLGVEVPQTRKKGYSGRVATVIIISSITVFIACAAVVLILIASCRCSGFYREPPLNAASSSFTKPSGAARSLALGSRSLSESMSFNSSTLNVTGYAKIYSLQDIEKATNAFDPTRVLGEGGFGIVYSGTFDDGEQVAVKVLKRENRHSAREFLSEVEMLSRLHHRNLVKLLGICTEEHIRCLVYELVPHGSVESHLHGVDKGAAHLDWPTRVKIALGAARGLDLPT